MERLVEVSSFPATWGLIWVASTSSGICAITLRGGRPAIEKRLRSRIGIVLIQDAQGNHEKIHRQLEEYFQGERREFETELDLRGTPFQMQTWRTLMEIPHGATCSYRDIAVKMGRPQAMRAVGQATGTNPVPIIVPCHRVIRANGKLGGFGGGVDIKEHLLNLEARFRARSQRATKRRSDT